MKITVGTGAGLPVFERRDEPVTVGAAFPRGRIHPGDGWSLADSRGQRCPVQATMLDRWSDGSIRWALLDFQAEVPAGQDAIYTLEDGGDGVCLPDVPLRIDVQDDAIAVRTGSATFHVARNGRSLFTDLPATLAARDSSGKERGLTIDRATVERSGALRAVIRVDGRLPTSGRRSLLDVTARLSFCAGLSTVQVELSITNPCPARHPGGFWDLGDAGSVLLRGVAMRIAPDDGLDGNIRCSVERTEPMVPVEGPLEIYQDSSGGENWQHVNHVNRLGRVPAAFRGYRKACGGGTSHGLRATPVVSAGTGAQQLTVAMRHFWENCPKAISVDPGGMTIALWPEQYGDLHELQGGERKTHTFALCVGTDTVSAEPLSWVRSPLIAVVDSSSYTDAGVCAPVRVGSDQARGRYDVLINTAVDDADGFCRRRELIDEYGWRNFGELYADHESVGSDTLLVSHYNNQYDAIAGFTHRFLLTGDYRWWTAADELAAHVTDIDLYHARGDRAAYSGGYFWHTNHYAAAHTATHRAYSGRQGSSGGGPSNEHNYTTGLMLHYFLTGSERSRDAVVQLAEWVLDMDDGAKSRFRWVDRGQTGLASSTRSSDYHGPGRGAGNSINALLDAHRLTGDSRYLAKADNLVRRSIHPASSPETLDLLDAENRWSYTVFLQALGKYLEYRAELGLTDESDAYARAALLTVAAWMASHERPYLEHPERLEFPTETWAAQDLRKAAVFEFAARHAAGDVERSLYLRRAGDFMNDAVLTLGRMPTAHLTRPIVLLLAYGFQRPMIEWPVPAAAPQVTGFAPAVPFVPVKKRLLRKLGMAAGLSAAAIVALVLSILRR